MNFAVPFSRKFKYLDQDVQLNIAFKPDIKALDYFVSVYGKQHRINFLIQEWNEEYLDIIQALVEKYSDYKLVTCLPQYNIKIDQIFTSKHLPHYYAELITSWDRFQGFLTLNITDIFIAEDLGFNIKTVKLNAIEKGIAIRSYCNVCESSWEGTPTIKKFFIRPEDIDLYAQYIDTFELFLDNNKDFNKLNILYEIYTKDKRWAGPLSEIIQDFNDSTIDNKFIVPIFGSKRINCKHKCMEGLLTGCQICDRILELSESFKNKDLFTNIYQGELNENESSQ